MKSWFSIIQLNALLLALVLLISITPKKYLHDAFAQHSDVGYAVTGSDASIQIAGWNCGFDHQVVESPVVAVVPFCELSVPLFYKMTGHTAWHASISQILLHIENKGPPSSILS